VAVPSMSNPERLRWPVALGLSQVGGVRATLGAVSEEAAVVSLAQDLADMAIKTEAAQASMDDLQAHTSNLLTLREVVGSLGEKTRLRVCDGIRSPLPPPTSPKAPPC
jgi:hypothetical protein